MLILGIESATGRVGCAVGTPDGVMASAHSSRGRRHAESLAPQVQFVCEQAGVSIRDVEVVAIDVGPGLYTGLRVGVTTALSIASTLSVPLVAVSSLDLLAWGAARSEGTVVASIDARRGEVFHAAYEAVPGEIKRVSEPAVARPEELRTMIESQPDDVLMVGDGALLYHEQFEDLSGVTLADQRLAEPSAESLVSLAGLRAVVGETVGPDGLELLYLRRPDAEAKWDKAPT